MEKRERKIKRKRDRETARRRGERRGPLEAHWPAWLRTVTRINYDVITSLAITIGGQDGRQIGSPRSPRVEGNEVNGETSRTEKEREKERERKREAARARMKGAGGLDGRGRNATMYEADEETQKTLEKEEEGCRRRGVRDRERSLTRR